MARRVIGDESEIVALLLTRKAVALSSLQRFDRARSAASECLRMYEAVSGRSSDGYIQGLSVLADILHSTGDFEDGLKCIEEARSLFPAADSKLFLSILNTHAMLLRGVKRFQEALLAREEALALSLRLHGPDHPEYGATCINAAILYAQLNQFARAIALAKQALAIHTKIFGPSHPTTQNTRNGIVYYQKALTDPAMKKQLVSSDRVCNIDGCNKVEKFMDRCMSCGAHYLCKKHRKKINEHVSVCPKFVDLLPDEKKGQTIVKCRRCRKESKLMKCSVCEEVWYCGAQCQKDDWKRHKVFCGKK